MHRVSLQFNDFDKYVISKREITARKPTHGLMSTGAGQGFRGRPGVQGGRPGAQGPARGPGWPARGSGAGQGSRVAGQGFRGRPLPHQRSRPICRPFLPNIGVKGSPRMAIGHRCSQGFRGRPLPHQRSRPICRPFLPNIGVKGSPRMAIGHRCSQGFRGPGAVG